MEYLQRTTTLHVTHIPHSILCQVGRTRLKKGAYFIRAKALAQEVLYGPGGGGGGGGYEYTPMGSMDYALFYVQKGVPWTPQRNFYFTKYPLFYWINPYVQSS